MSTASHPGILHEYAPSLVTFEFTSPGRPQGKPNSLIFVGGLTDGLKTVPYVANLAKALEPTEWSVFNTLLSSSYIGFGLSSLDQDVEQIGQGGKVVIMGHSTGSQDVLHYIYAQNPFPRDPAFDVGLKFLTRPPVDGAILQAPVSDREAVAHLIKMADKPNEARGAYEQLVSAAKRQPWTDDKKDCILPLKLTSQLGLPGHAPISARRFLSLLSPDSPEHPEQDDLFSSDLTDKRHKETFGQIAARGLLRSKLLVLYSGSDEYCPPSVDKTRLLERWKQATEDGGASWDENSGIVPGATHNARDEGQEDLIGRVVRYLQGI
ncbi:hypothetical protein N7468_004410 [Penicillium chermesinum]|uniref:Uncharacterized protein n=1 Tax=Penicillium chermesinum TaxID=63820 RepID=A0A9W9P894_9EURO|nr:uncharacterized protein N7468_004410 [Penicillium chermesinum]KAJ5239791.1 hypothetical protein N7468_004410 [Penicillium chermesinum]